jgi:L-asparaginase II
VIQSTGDISRKVFPRSAVKALQCLAVFASGAVQRLAFTDEEIALMCSSHNGEPEHLSVATSILKKAGLDENAYECGAHWPSAETSLHDLIRSGGAKRQIHNNCSGKHAGMLASAVALGVDPKGYKERTHQVQRRIASILSEMCEIDIDSLPCGVDGCSVPTWAIPIENLARGFARLVSSDSDEMTPSRRAACERIVRSCRAHPFLVAGTDRFCTRVMTAVPRVFVKVGAEGVFVAAVQHAGIGVCVKIDDGASRASELTLIAVLLTLPDGVWTEV